jgi:hypothetical protein
MLKASLKGLDEKPFLGLFDLPLNSRVCLRGNSIQNTYFPTTPLMTHQGKVIRGSWRNLSQESFFRETMSLLLSRPNHNGG